MARPEYLGFKNAMEEIWQDFEELRPLLFAIAYRMLGSAVDAEDIVQEAYLRYQAADRENIRAPKAFLTTVVTRLSIDQLKSARRQRESYVGAWLPEPLLTTSGDQPAELVALNDSLSTAFLVLLETLNPVERAVFLLREVFDYDYAAIAEIVDKSESACRQALHRAREALRSGRPRFHSTADEHRLVFTRFLEACGQGDVQGLEAILAADVTALSDGGGKASAATGRFPTQTRRSAPGSSFARFGRRDCLPMKRGWRPRTCRSRAGPGRGCARSRCWRSP